MALVPFYAKWLVQQHFGEFLAQIEAGARGGRLPAFVTEEFAAYLGCGLLSRGLRARAVRAVRRRDGGGVQLQRPILPLVWRPPHDGAVPVRQWVRSLPWSLRYQLAFDAALCRDVLAVFIRVVFGWVRRRAENAGLRDGQCGAITVIQRFGGALNLNVHCHSLVLDGVFTSARPTAAPVFQSQRAPTDASRSWRPSPFTTIDVAARLDVGRVRRAA